ncbi:adenosine deaminase domain-containing protein 1 [Eucyclogobius newberryi]|uniref:adenosine deaminase domain-containing protein 1 n=1 Tax=Eucyclogobius newberryi TaxID=166745 RepID=UPI003B5A4A33
MSMITTLFGMLPGNQQMGRGVSYSQALKKDRPHTTLPAFNTYNTYEKEPPRGAYRPEYMKPNCTTQMLIDRYMEGETHPVSLLYELSHMTQFHLEMKETGGSENIPGFYFAFCAVINGVEYKTGVGTTKKDARSNAAKLALEDLLPTLGNYTSPILEESGVPPPLPVNKEPTISQASCRAIRERKNPGNLQIPFAVKDQLTKLMNNHPEFSNCAGTTAAFVIQTGSGCEVVALGTGNYSTKDHRESPNGRVVHDSHAVVTARRSLMRYLYRHLLMFFSKTSNLTEKSIFEMNSHSGLLCLKSSMTLNLYVNQVPKGAAQIPSNLRLNPCSIATWQDNNEISLHLSVEGKVFSVFSPALEQLTSNFSMSATDKITQWQVLGYQGALLSHFIEPVYVQSILIGDSGCKDTRGMEISVSQRVEGITSQLPIYYCMERPHICLVQSVATCGKDGGHLKNGINWSEGDSSLEVVDGLEGKTIEESPFKSGSALASRLCKAAMFHRFKLVAKEAQRQNLLSTRSYREAKRMAKPYQEAKTLLREYLSQQGFGSWLAKCSVSDNFSL